MATHQSSRKSGSSHGKSGGSKGGSSSGSKTRNGSRGHSERGRSSRHGRPGAQASSSPGSRGRESGAGESQEQGGAASVKGAGSKVVDSVKQHPLAASAIGVGIAAGLTYMAVRAFRGPSEQEDGQQDQDGSDEGDAQMSSQTAGEEDEGGDDEEGGEEEDEEDPGLISRTRDALGSAGSRIGQGASSLWENHPLAVGAGILGAGIAAGMLLPSSDSEKRLFGRTSGKLTGRIRSAGQELFEQGKEIASKVMTETTETLREEADREGLTPDRLARKMKRIVNKVKDAVVTAATE